MITRTVTAVLTLVLLMAVLTGPARASLLPLLDIGTATYGGSNFNLIYETGGPGGPIVWLDYSNKGPGGNGDTWQNQMTWASGLNNAGVLTYNFLPGYSMNWSSGWQLPTTLDGTTFGYDGTTAGGYNITSSPMGYLYYTDLGNKGYYDTSGTPQAGYGLLNTGPFTHLSNNNWYWSGTEYSASPGYAWLFLTNSGYQTNFNENFNLLGLADRPGQLEETATAPEPSTMLLLVVGLAGLAGVRYRRRGR
jgi:hypothetical protein